MTFNILLNYSHMYYSYYSIIKYANFYSIHYDINLDVVLFSKVFSELDYVFLSNLIICFYRMYC